MTTFGFEFLVRYSRDREASKPIIDVPEFWSKLGRCREWFSVSSPVLGKPNTMCSPGKAMRNRLRSFDSNQSAKFNYTRSSHRQETLLILKQPCHSHGSLMPCKDTKGCSYHVCGGVRESYNSQDSGIKALKRHKTLSAFQQNLNIHNLAPY